MCFRAPLVALLATVLPAVASGGRAELVAAFDDEASDADGPGSYHKPGDSEIVDGDFDLRRFEVWRDGEDVLFKVTMGSVFREPGVMARSWSTPHPLWNHIYLQNVDIYIDTDPGSTAGYSVCVPGRRVAFTAGRTWKVAVVLTPQPGPARAITEDALGEAGKHVLFPADLTTGGRTVTARVPAAALGGPPRPSWAYSVHVSGARWERNLSATERLLHGKREADAFTMPVVGVTEAWAFGGAPEGTAYPRVIDVLLPRGVDQRAVLGSFDERSGQYARVPFVGGGEPPAPPKPAAPSVKVADVSGTTVTVAGDVTGMKPMMIGQVLGPDGAPVARVVVTRVLEGGLVCNVLDGGEAIRRGALVTFDTSGP